MGLQTCQFSSINMFYLFLWACIYLLYAKGEIFIVGDGYGWDDLYDFSNWSDGIEFHVGDVLVFNYESGLHNVLQVDYTGYENCVKDSYIQSFSSGNDSVILKEGRAWFICGINDHCENGQKLDINVIP